jgi:acyl dehydratase
MRFFLAYVLSYVNLGIYWNNHHHMLYAGERIPVSSAKLRDRKSKRKSAVQSTALFLRIFA